MDKEIRLLRPRVVLELLRIEMNWLTGMRIDVVTSFEYGIRVHGACTLKEDRDGRY